MRGQRPAPAEVTDHRPQIVRALDPKGNGASKSRAPSASQTSSPTSPAARSAALAPDPTIVRSPPGDRRQMPFEHLTLQYLVDQEFFDHDVERLAVALKDVGGTLEGALEQAEGIGFDALLELV